MTLVIKWKQTIVRFVGKPHEDVLVEVLDQPHEKMEALVF